MSICVSSVLQALNVHVDERGLINMIDLTIYLPCLDFERFAISISHIVSSSKLCCRHCRGGIT